MCKEHVAALWTLTQQRIALPKDSPRWQLRFEQTVQQRPLSVFEEAAR